MKKMLSALALVAAVLMFPVSSQAQDAPALSDKQLELIKTNVLANLHHSSLEVRASTMQLLIDMKKIYPQYDLNYAVIPMMETLKSDPKPEFRILAALALYHLNSELGRFAVERRAKFDENDRVARQCASLVRNWDDPSKAPDLVVEVKKAL
ncbi:MAG: hypothetical protein JXA28_13575 [Bacteroidetes bacterium]|nr:hypothetical protein [Bacteroidota bacterium]